MKRHISTEQRRQQEMRKSIEELQAKIEEIDAGRGYRHLEE